MMYSPASRPQSSISIRLFTLFFLFLNVSISPGFPSLVHAKPALSPEKTMVMSKIKAMEQISGGPLKVTISRKSGLATFLATKPGKEIPIPGLAFGNAKERARSFLKEYGETFGLHGPSEYRIMQDRGPDEIGMDHVRIQQLFKGIPITGGQLTVHMRGSLVTAVHAKTLGNITQLQTSPTIDPADAVTSAKQMVKKYYGVTNAVYSTPRLEIFNRGY